MNKGYSKSTNNATITEFDKERKARMRKKSFTRLYVIVLIILVIVIAPTIIRKASGNNVDTDIIKMGAIEDSVNVKATLIRNEILLQSKLNGKCIPHYEEGEKIPAKADVGTVVKLDSEDLLNRLKTLEIRITTAKEEKLKNKDFFGEDIKKVDSEIVNKVTSLIAISNNLNVSAYMDIKKSINDLLQKKTDIINMSSNNDVFLQDLDKQKADIEAQIKDKMSDIVSDSAGIVSYIIDGFEGELSFATLDSLTAESLTDINKRITQHKPKENVTDSKPYAKVIGSIDYYIATVLKTNEAYIFEKGTDLLVRINDKNIILNSKLYAYKKSGDKTLLILKTDIGLSDLVSLRTADADFIINNFTGLKVPRKSLVDINKLSKTAQIACVKANYVHFLTVNIIGMNNDYAIIGNADVQSNYKVVLNDIFIINPDKVKEGQLIY